MGRKLWSTRHKKRHAVVKSDQLKKNKGVLQFLGALRGNLEAFGPTTKKPVRGQPPKIRGKMDSMPLNL